MRRLSRSPPETDPQSGEMVKRRTAAASLICFTTTLGLVVEAAWRTAGLIEVLRYLGVVSPFHFGRLKVL